MQKKLSKRTKTERAPRVSKMYLTGLVVCAGCGRPMNTRGARKEYICATWNKHRLTGDIATSPCQSNPVKQSVIEEYIARYLDETQQRLSVLMPAKAEAGLTGKLEDAHTTAWFSFRDGIARLERYLADHHPEEYNALLRYESVPPEEGGPGHISDHVESVVGLYRDVFDPAAMRAEIDRLDAEHTKKMKEWADLPTPRAKEKAGAELAALEARIKELEKVNGDAAGVVESQYREMESLASDIAQARLAMRKNVGEGEMRQRAELLRSILCRVECEFVLTTRPTKGRGNWARSKLVGLTFVPIAGDSWASSVETVPGASDSTGFCGQPSGRHRPPGRCHPRGV